MPMNKGTIIFDFDGTIADSFEVVLDLFYELTGHERFTAQQITELRGTPVRKVIKAIGIPLRQMPRLLVQGRALMHQRMHEVRVFPGLHESLATLHQAGWQLMVISTNSQQNVEVYLREHGLYEYFDHIYGGVGLFSKTQSLRKVLRQNKLDRTSCFYVGDEVRDMQAAHRAHVNVVAVAWGYNDASILRAEEPYAVAERPADLVQIFAAEGSK